MQSARVIPEIVKSSCVIPPSWWQVPFDPKSCNFYSLYWKDDISLLSKITPAKFDLQFKYFHFRNAGHKCDLLGKIAKSYDELSLLDAKFNLAFIFRDILSFWVHFERKDNVAISNSYALAERWKLEGGVTQRYILGITVHLF